MGEWISDDVSFLSGLWYGVYPGGISKQLKGAQGVCSWVGYQGSSCHAFKRREIYHCLLCKSGGLSVAIQEKCINAFLFCFITANVLYLEQGQADACNALCLLYRCMREEGVARYH
jgi:hypothetical protein